MILGMVGQSARRKFSDLGIGGISAVGAEGTCHILGMEFGVRRKEI